MKVAFLGDIHGNDLALEMVLAAAASLGVDRLLITGDFVGYYFKPLRVLELLKEWNWDAVRGNHEDMLKLCRQDERNIKLIEIRYGSGIRIAMEELAPTALDDLCDLPQTLLLRIDECNILLCHGSPWDTDHYIYPDANRETLERCVSTKWDVVVLGHTHYPMIHKIGSTIIVNPGSVGQPRNRIPGAHWALFDSENKTVQLRCEKYDSSQVIADARSRHPEIPYLAEVLVRQ